MRKLLFIICVFFLTAAYTSCTPESLTENETLEFEGTGHGEVGDNNDDDDEEEVGG